MRSLIRIIIALIAALSVANAQNARKGEIMFKGTIRLPGNIKSNSDTLFVKYDKPFSPWGSMNSTAYVNMAEDGDFTFTLPKYDQPFKLEILVRVNGKWKSLKSYFVESDDQIKIDILKTDEDVTAMYSGKGSGKYTIAEKLEGLAKEWERSEDALKLYEPEDINSKLSKLDDLTTKIEQKRLRLIANSNLSDKMKKMVSYEYNPIFSAWSLRLNDYYTSSYKNNSELRSIIKNSYNKNKTKYFYKIDPLMSNCPLFLGKLSGQEMRDLNLNSTSDSVGLQEFYNKIKSKYTGLIRERLITNLFLGYAGFNNLTKWNVSILDSLMKDGEKYVTLPFVRERFIKALRLNKGEALFSTTFINQEGETISTESLKGKVVFIDMWGTGCSACARFYQKFHKDFYPLIKDNKEFVYLSISTDKTKEKWERAINSGRYTSKDYLNVHFGELGLDHPFAKYYGIQGAPFLLVVGRDGNIFASIFKSDENVKDMVMAALSEKELIATKPN